MAKNKIAPEEMAEAINYAMLNEDEAALKVLCDQINNWDGKFISRISKEDSLSILSDLRSISSFELLGSVSYTLISRGKRDSQIQRQYAQAMIETGTLDEAVFFLKGVMRTPRQPEEINEASGLFGRLFKDRYLKLSDANLARRSHLLKNAIDFYNTVYRKDKDTEIWHGINVVALLARAERDGVPSPTMKSYKAIARQILESINKRNRPHTYWECATALEAAIALGDITLVKDWACEIEKSNGSSFELNSTRRQLKDVWKIEIDSEFGEIIFPLLEP